MNVADGMMTLFPNTDRMPTETGWDHALTTLLTQPGMAHRAALRLPTTLPAAVMFYRSAMWWTLHSGAMSVIDPTNRSRWRHGRTGGHIRWEDVLCRTAGDRWPTRVRVRPELGQGPHGFYFEGLRDHWSHTTGADQRTEASSGAAAEAPSGGLLGTTSLASQSFQCPRLLSGDLLRQPVGSAVVERRMAHPQQPFCTTDQRPLEVGGKLVRHGSENKDTGSSVIPSCAPRAQR